MFKIRCNSFLDIDVSKRGAGALKFANFGDDFRADRNANLLRDFSNDLGRAPFVGGIAKTIEITNTNGPNALIAQLSDQPPNKIFIQRLKHAAIGCDAFGNIKAALEKQGRRIEDIDARRENRILLEVRELNW